MIILNIINRGLKYTKDKKHKAIFAKYLKIFMEQNITLKNYINFYNEIGNIYI